ncbi:hypothetical protein L208DRAFT_1381041 [Tricholoma matsutake]|nr:hypothetical protein L208DRAFT_1381041 [Tricholoma matsutake 945]
MQGSHDDEVLSIAPSTLANSPHFTAWATGASLQQITSPLTTTSSIFEELCHFILPKFFTRIPKHTNFHRQDEFYQSLRDWGQSNGDSVHTSDVHNMIPVAEHLYGLYYSVREAVDEDQNESAQRRGVDSLIQLAFASRKEGAHKVGVENPVKLFNSVCPSISVGPKAFADTVVMMPIPKAMMDKIHTAIRKGTDVEVREEIISRLYWQPTVEDENSLMDFCGEFKKRPGFYNRNQLLIDLRTAQSQRRAFGLPDIIVWGAVCAAGRFQVYSSNWSEDRVSAKTLETLDAVAVAQQCTNFPWPAPRPARNRNAKRARRDDEAEQVAGPSHSGNVDDLGWMADVGDSGMPGYVLCSGKNADGYDDWDAEESASWDKAIQDWCREAASIPTSNKLSEGLLKALPVGKVPVYDHHRGLIK